MPSSPSLSPRLAAVVDALPLAPGLRVLEIGGAPGTAAREVVRRVVAGGARGHVHVVDRSAGGARAIERLAAAEIAAGSLSVSCGAVEDFVVPDGDQRFDLAYAVRVGALDGRHPQAGVRARDRLRAALVPGGRLFVDGGDPLREVAL